jgi:hypothetical protein
MELVPHPDSAPVAVRSLTASARYGADGALDLSWQLTGDARQLRLAPPGPPARADRLWEHTCFEAFVADPHSTAYVELNFAPSGGWAAYGFRGYRDGGTALPLREAPAATWRQAADTLNLDVRFRMDSLPGPPGPRPPVAVRVALAAVLEDHAGALAWWSLRHPPGKPDFHHPDAFGIEVAP